MYSPMHGQSILADPPNRALGLEYAARRSARHRYGGTIAVIFWRGDNTVSENWVSRIEAV
jgi:hypothetical protein